MLEVAMQDAIPQVDRIDERSFDGTTQGGQSLEFEDNGFLRMGDLFRNSPMISPIATITHRITLTIPIMLRQMSKKHLPRRKTRRDVPWEDQDYIPLPFDDDDAAMDIVDSEPEDSNDAQQMNASQRRPSGAMGNKVQKGRKLR
jgi:hypothetical protein